MFENLVECAKNQKSDRKWSYFAVTSIIWTLALIGAITSGIYFYDAHLDEQLSLITMLALPVPPPPPAPPAGHSNNVKAQPTSTQVVLPIDMAVVKPPTSIDSNPNPNVQVVLANAKVGGDDGVLGGLDNGGTVGGVIGGDPNGIIGGTGTPVHTAAGSEIPPPPPTPEKPQQPTIVRRSEGVIRGNTVTQVKPEYPMIARTAHVSGDVQIEITISEDGRVMNARVISGHPLLQQAALSAAQQWRFNPTMLNNSPVKVQGVLTFRFTL